MSVPAHASENARSSRPEQAALPRIARVAEGDSEQDLETVLHAWQTATDRLQATHQTLCAEVRRLSNELEKKNRELARKNRLTDLGQMASLVAHEVRNCLMPITLYMSLLRRRLESEPDTLQFLDKLESGFRALEATVNDLLHFTANRDPQRGPCRLRQLVSEVCDSLKPQLAAQNVDTSIDIGATLEVSADREMLRRAVLNLLLNALDAMPQGGELVITGCPGLHGGIDLEIADSGPGVEPEQRRRLFEPFFSTKQGGTGLGLAIVGRVAEAHGGHVRVQNCPEGGAAFTIHLPRIALLQEAAA